MIHYQERLKDVDPRLVSVVLGVLLDVTVVCGVRDKAAQNLAYQEKRSKEVWPFSKHNINAPERPFAEAVDLCPYPVNWAQTERFYMLAGAMLQEAARQGIPLRWGGNWAGDGLELVPQTFNDIGHFELRATE